MKFIHCTLLGMLFLAGCERPPDKAVVFCVDEKSGIQALDRTRPVLPLRPRIPERQTARSKQGEAFKGFKMPSGQPDDLKLIAGITPELEAKLNKLGLIKFEQIANLSDDDIAKLDETLGLDGRIENDDWTSKAVALMAETTADEVPAGEDEA